VISTAIAPTGFSFPFKLACSARSNRRKPSATLTHFQPYQATNSETGMISSRKRNKFPRKRCDLTMTTHKLLSTPTRLHRRDGQDKTSTPSEQRRARAISTSFGERSDNPYAGIDITVPVGLPAADRRAEIVRRIAPGTAALDADITVTARPSRTV